MGFIVYNKDTKGYLKKHSGSYRRFRRYVSYDIQKELKEKSVLRPFRTDTKAYDEYWSAVHKEVSKRIFSAIPETARDYLTKGGALNSVGFHGRKLGEKMRLPDNLEIYEIRVKITKIYTIHRGEKS